MFLFKKIVSQFLYPLSFTLLFSFFGLFLLFFTKRQKTGKAIAAASLLILLLSGYGGIADRVIGPLEGTYTPYSLIKQQAPSSDSPAIPLQFIVVLGASHTSDPRLPVTSQLNQIAVVRLIEGINIYRKNPGSKLILSGGVICDPVSHAEAMAKVAEELGVEMQDIILETKSLDTEDEALFIKSMVGDHPFALVTSAAHMPRSMALFKKQGMDPIPAPTGHYVKSRQGPLGIGHFFPSSDNLKKMEYAVHEYLGMAWARLRGRI